jgi:hypothetical protein
MRKSKRTASDTEIPQPGQSRATLERTADGFTLKLPPTGISRAGHGLFWIGLCFCAGVAVVSLAWVFIAGAGETRKGVYTPPDPNRASMPWQMWLGMAGFGLLSMALTLYGLSLGVRSAVIEVAGDVLRFQEKGLFRTRTFQWKRKELQGIQAGPSGMSVGGTRKTGRSGAAGFSIQQLHLYSNDGRRIRLLSGRDEKELDWVAAQLRTALSVATTSYDGS